MAETVTEEIRTAHITFPNNLVPYTRWIKCEPTSFASSTWWKVYLDPSFTYAKRVSTQWQFAPFELFRSTDGAEALKVQVELQTRYSVLRKLEGLE